MNYILIPDTPPPSIEDSARHMVEWRCQKARERKKAFHRQMRAELRLPRLPALEPRG